MRRSVITFTENPQFVLALGAVALALVLTATVLEGNRWLGLAVAAMGAGAALRAMGASITVTAMSITRTSPFGEWRLLWDEVERVEIGPACSTLVLHGAGKRIWMLRPTSSLDAWFKGETDDTHEEPLVALVLGMAEAHGAVFVSGWLTPFQTSRA